ncbi:hypothetical protein phiFa_33 [Thermus phage phiFa]|nr:hypothetical protein phiFa_33 [Thermus phage phiFa]
MNTKIALERFRYYLYDIDGVQVLHPEDLLDLPYGAIADADRVLERIANEVELTDEQLQAISVVRTVLAKLMP